MSDLRFLAQAVSFQREQDLRRQRYHDDPVLWANEVAGVFLWSKQRELSQSVVDNKDNAIKAGHGTGKSFWVAILICWWVDTRPNGFVASTAPSASQIGAIVWREIRSIYRRVEQRYNEGVIDHKLPGWINSDTKNPEWKGDNGSLIGFGRKPPDQKTDDAFQGIHAPDGVLAVGDEAVGLTEEMIDALGNITSTEESRRVLICNPTNPASHVGKLFKSKPTTWKFHTISVFDSPNFTGEEVPPDVARALTDQSYVDSKREEYGEGTPRWMSRVLGEFAWDAGYTLFRTEDLAVGFDTELVPDPDSKKVLGVDVSRSKSGDKNTVYSCQDGVLRYVTEWNDPNAMNTAARIHELALEHEVPEVRIDGTGLGGPIADRVNELSSGRYDVIEIMGGDRSPDKARWYNFRAWMYWSVQDRLTKGQIDLDPTDEELSDQLLSIPIKKRTSGNDSLLLESKEELRKAGVHSPDHADAAMYAAVDLSPWTGNPLNSLEVGSVVAVDPAKVEIIDPYFDAIEF